MSIQLPVLGQLFWSVTVYDAETRSQVQTPEDNAALRSLFELKEPPATGSAELRFGPTEPTGDSSHWIQTVPDRGWFGYIRVYGPQQQAFDGSWRPGDFEHIG